MKGKVVPLKNKRRTLALNVGLFLFAVYLLVYRGGFHSIDEVSIFATTESLVKFGRFNTDQIAWTQWTTSQAEAQGFFGQDNHVYSKKGVGLSLAQAPLYWLALVLPNIGMLQTVSILNALVTAASGLLLFMFVHRLSFSVLTATLSALIYGLATIAFIYAKYLFSEPLAGFFLLLAAYMLFTYRQEGGLRHVAIAGLAAGFAVLTRANNLFLLPVFGVYLLWIVYRPMITGDRQTLAKAPNHPLTFVHSPRRAPIHLRFGPVFVFILAAAIVGAMLMGYNALRSGHPLQTGYDLTLFSPNILLGLYKLLFSPLRGLFIYSPILLLSLPGWWLFRQTRPAEAWLFAGLASVTTGLFSAWSSGEGLSWGSRFLVPVVPFFVIWLAPLLERATTRHATDNEPKSGRRLQPARLSLYLLLALSCFIQLLGLAINPWVFLARLQADFGGEFFLEKTEALFDFRYSQIVGQLQSWSPANSDLAWWQPWGFDGLAFGLSLSLVLLSGWLLWRQISTPQQPTTANVDNTVPGQIKERTRRFLAPVAIPGIVTMAMTYLLLARYFITDRQFGPPDDDYTRALNTVVTLAASNDRIITVAQNHYHVPMNRFKARLPITGFAQQTWPPPEPALPLLKEATAGQNTWLITIGFPPAAPDNVAEQWLAYNTFKASDEWFGEVRLVRFRAGSPGTARPIGATLGQEVRLVEVNLIESLRPTRPLPVEFIWQPLSQPKADYNLFLQLLATDGTLVAQHDNPPQGGYAPTSTWLPGQPVVDRHALILPPNLPPDDYRLIAGLYDPTTGKRLAVPPHSDFVELGNIRIK